MYRFIHSLTSSSNHTCAQLCTQTRTEATKVGITIAAAKPCVRACVCQWAYISGRRRHYTHIHPWPRITGHTQRDRNTHTHTHAKKQTRLRDCNRGGRVTKENHNNSSNSKSNKSKSKSKNTREREQGHNTHCLQDKAHSTHCYDFLFPIAGQFMD